MIWKSCSNHPGKKWPFECGWGGAKAKRAMPKCPPREFEGGFPNLPQWAWDQNGPMGSPEGHLNGLVGFWNGHVDSPDGPVLPSRVLRWAIRFLKCPVVSLNGQNVTKVDKMCQNSQKLPKVAKNSQKLPKVARSCQKIFRASFVIKFRASFINFEGEHLIRPPFAPLLTEKCNRKLETRMNV